MIRPRVIRLSCIAFALLACSCVATAASAPETRSGSEIMQRFHAGLAEDGCKEASPRWRRHYAHSANRLAGDAVALALFGYVLDAVRDARLPSEFALIPFVESRYLADARSIGGPAGLWQFTAATARHHGMRVGGAIDQRTSPVSSTRAAVAYLGRLHRMFGRDWRRTTMAYNAGEGALKASRSRQGRVLSGITRSYPDKLHAIACLFDARRDDTRWQRAIRRQVPQLAPRRLPAGIHNLRAWARQQGLDPVLMAALNPGWHSGNRDVLAPVAGSSATGRDGLGKAN